MDKYKLILAMPSHSVFFLPIQKNLEFHNFDIEFINCSPEHLRKIRISFRQYILIFIHGFILGKKNYKKLLKNQLKNQIITNDIKQKLKNKDFSYSLVIRPDLFLASHLDLIKEHTTKSFIGYQWNGLGRFIDTFPLISRFDRFFVFDSHDLSNPAYHDYAIQGITNFYFDMYLPQPIAHEGKVAYFVGLHFDERVDSINYCAEELSKNGLILDFNIRILRDKEASQKKYSMDKINFIQRDINFEENIEHINRADILVDVVNPVHNGLSFRTFEALYYQKKLITNNQLIKDYDFYHPANIFIWDGSDLSGLSDFLATPCVVLDSKIIEKYSFHNWIRNILDIAPYQPIDLPDIFVKISIE